MSGQGAVRPAWTGKRFGRLRVLGKLRSPDDETWYLCKCDCGQKMRCTYGELSLGMRTGCDKCGPEDIKAAALATAKTARESEGWSFCSMVKPTLVVRLKVLNEYVPDWWWPCLNVIVDEMCQMLGRGEYTDAQVAKFFECPVVIVDAVRGNYKKRIKQIHKEYLAVKEQFKHIQRIPSELISDHDVVTLLTEALSSRRGIRSSYYG